MKNLFQDLFADDQLFTTEDDIDDNFENYDYGENKNLNDDEAHKSKNNEEDIVPKRTIKL